MHYEAIRSSLNAHAHNACGTIANAFAGSSHVPTFATDDGDGATPDATGQYDAKLLNQRAEERPDHSTLTTLLDPTMTRRKPDRFFFNFLCGDSLISQSKRSRTQANIYHVLKFVEQYEARRSRDADAVRE